MNQHAVQQQDAADEVRAFTMAALAADLGVLRTQKRLGAWMNHAEWTARFKDAVRLSTDEPERASAMLVELADAAELASKEHLNEWHQQQALGTAGSLLEESGHLDEAMEMYRRTLELCQGWAGFWSRATTSMLAILALLQFQRGMDEEAMKTGQEALRFLGREPDSDAILAKLMKQMAQHRAKNGAGEQ